MNLLETVLDYMLQTEVVVKALERFRGQRWHEVRSLDDLERLMAQFPDDQAGNTALAQHLWGYNHWKRAQQLRDLVRYFHSIASSTSSGSNSGRSRAPSRPTSRGA
jgi:ribosomal 50S subunit-associated protein YjgA (DUF615 family)